MQKNTKLRTVRTKSAGQKLVEALRADIDAAGLEPDVRAEEMLALACAIRDRMQDLEAMVEEDGARAVSASGLVRLHPAIAEHRAQARVLAGLLAHLDVTAASKDPVKVRAAQTRWRARNAARQHNIDKYGGA